MPTDTRTTVKIFNTNVLRLDALAESKTLLGGHEINRSDLVNVCVARTLPVLEAEMEVEMAGNPRLKSTGRMGQIIASHPTLPWQETDKDGKINGYSRLTSDYLVGEEQLLLGVIADMKAGGIDYVLICEKAGLPSVWRRGMRFLNKESTKRH